MSIQDQSTEEKVKICLAEKIHDLKQALNFGKSDYLSPSHDVSHPRRQYSVRLHYSNSIDLFENPSLAQTSNKDHALGSMTPYSLQDKAEDHCPIATETLEDLIQKHSDLSKDLQCLEVEYSSKFPNSNTDRSTKVSHLNQILRSIDIISKTHDLKISRFS